MTTRLKQSYCLVDARKSKRLDQHHHSRGRKAVQRSDLLNLPFQVAYATSFVQLYAEEATRVRGDVLQSPVRDRRLLAVKQPVGPAALITPWNFPSAMITRKVPTDRPTDRTEESTVCESRNFLFYDIVSYLLCNCIYICIVISGLVYLYCLSVCVCFPIDIVSYLLWYCICIVIHGIVY